MNHTNLVLLRIKSNFLPACRKQGSWFSPPGTFLRAVTGHMVLRTILLLDTNYLILLKMSNAG